VAFVGGLEFFDEAGEEARAFCVGGCFVMLHEVATAAAEDFADRRGREVGDFGCEIAGAEPVEEFVGGAEGAVFEGIDKEGLVVGVAADHEVCGQADRFEIETEALTNEYVDQTECDGNAFAADEDLLEEAIEGIGVVLGVATKTVFVEEHAVDDAAFCARGHRFGEKFAAAGGEGVEFFAAGADVDVWKYGAVEEERTGFEFVVERTDEAAELGDGITELELFEKPAGVPGEGTVFAVGDGF